MVFDIRNPKYTITAYFDDIQDFHPAVYLLERTGFQISATLQPPTGSISQTVARIGSGNIAPIRLSSITPFQSQSQPELYPTQNSSFGNSNAHVVSDSQSLQRTGSMPFHPFYSAYSPFPMPAIQGELNPYKYFASHQSTSANSQLYNPLPSIGFRDQVVPSVVQPMPPWETLMATQKERTNQRISGEYAVPAPEELTEATKLNVKQLDAIPLAKEVDFRLLMPQARSLPFQNSAHRTVEQIESEPQLNTLKRKNLSDSPPSAQPAKRRSANEGKTSVEKKNRPKSSRYKGKSDSVPTHENVPLTERVQRPTPKAAPKIKTANEAVASKKPATKRPQKKALKKAAPPKTSVRKASPKNSLTQKPSTEVQVEKNHEKEKPPGCKEVEQLSSVSPSSEPSNEPAALDTKSSKKRTTRSSRAKVLPTTGSFHSLQECSEHQAPPPAEVIKDRHLQKEITKSNFLEKEFNSTLVVAEPKMLDALNRMTWDILKQYEADLESGRNRFEVAQFYVDNMYDTRFAFWYAKLKKLGGLDARHVREPVF